MRASSTLLALLLAVMPLRMPLANAQDANYASLERRENAHRAFLIRGSQSASLVISQGSVWLRFGKCRVKAVDAVDLDNMPSDVDASAPLRDIAYEVADYNFDGFPDVAVETSSGYGGVNLFFNVWVFTPKSGCFTKVLSEVSNIARVADKKRLHASMKSGREAVRDEYAFHHGKAVRVLSEVSDFEFSSIREWNLRGQVTARRFEWNGAAEPIKLKIGVPRVPLFSSASVSARTSMYLVQGDEVVLLDRQSENEDWFLVQYRTPSGKTIQKWLRGNGLDWSSWSQCRSTTNGPDICPR
jgi:hypothetical protein